MLSEFVQLLAENVQYVRTRMSSIALPIGAAADDADGAAQFH
jgi:hypothetical protein